MLRLEKLNAEVVKSQSKYTSIITNGKKKTKNTTLMVSYFFPQECYVYQQTGKYSTVFEIGSASGEELSTAVVLTL